MGLFFVVVLILAVLIGLPALLMGQFFKPRAVTETPRKRNVDLLTGALSFPDLLRSSVDERR